MNLTLERAPALSALSRVVGVVERKNTIPILGNVALKAEGSMLQVRATDLDMEAVERIPAQVDMDGEITLPADKLHDIVRNSDTGAQVSLAFDGLDDPRVKVRSGRSNFRIPMLPADQFPTFMAQDFREALTVKASLLADMLSRASVLKGSATPFTAMSCVFLASEGEELRAVTCSHAGIAIRREKVTPSAPIAAILPPKFVAQVGRWLSAADGDCVVSCSDTLIRVEHEGAMLTSKLYDGSFFDYGRLLLEEHEASARVAQDELAAAVRRVLVVADAKTLSVRLTFSDGKAVISSKNEAHAGEGTEEIGAEYDGSEASFLLFAGQLQEVLGTLSGDIVELCFAPKVDDRVNKTKQVVLKAPADPGFVANLMQPRV